MKSAAPITRRPYARRPAWAWIGALAGAVAAAIALGSPTFLATIPRYACRVTDAAGRSYELAGPSAEQTRSMALDAARSIHPAAEAARARLAAYAADMHPAPSGSLAPLVPAAECAALLRARAEIASIMAGAPSGVDEPGGQPLSNELADADQRLEAAALLGEPAALRLAMRETDAAEGRWLARLTPVPRLRFGAWRDRERDLSSQYRIAAEDLEALQTQFQRDVITQWLPQLVLELESGALGTLASMPGPGVVSVVRRLWLTWVLGIAAGSLAGALITRMARGAIRLGSRRRERIRDDAPTLGAAAAAPVARVAEAPPPGAGRPSSATQARAASASASVWGFRPHRGHGARAVAPGPLLAPAVGPAWLHVVSGPDPALIGRAAGELAAPLVARSSRVLIVEAGRRLRLHESFGCAPRWGVGECLSGELPLLGTVQRAGVRDLYLLAAGSYSGRGSCPALARVLGEAKRHFSAVVVALDAAVPAEFRALAEGREAEAWWPSRSGRLPGAAMRFGERVGIPVTPFGLPPRSANWLEAIERRIEALRAVLAPARAEALEPLEPPGRAIAERTPGARAATMPTPRRAAQQEPAPATAPPAQAVALADDSKSPFVLRPAADADQRAKERLRFLLWMRQVRAERSRRMTPVA